MATLAALTSAELEQALDAQRIGFADDTVDRKTRRAQLRDLHELLLRATPLSEQAPLAALAAAAELLDSAPKALIESMPPRARTAFRLLRGGVPGAAWAVLIDSATGVVEEPWTASTATGAAPTARRLPLLTKLEPPHVFADLPGFRDPRFGAPDDCYDMTDTVVLSHALEQFVVADGGVTIGGWAALDGLITGASEQVSLVAELGGTRVTIPGRRHRRADLVTGTGNGLVRSAWGGWSAHLDGRDPLLTAGSWTLYLALSHHGISREVRLGTALSELARASLRAGSGASDVAIRLAVEAETLLVVL